LFSHPSAFHNIGLLHDQFKVAGQVRAYTEVTWRCSEATQAHPLRSIPMQDSEVRTLLAGRYLEAHGHHAAGQRGIDFRIKGRNEGELAIQLAGQVFVGHPVK